MEMEDLPEDDADLPTQFDLICISSFSAKISHAYDLADRYRALGIPVVLGGLHVTSMPDEAALHADAIVVGEGEPTWLELLADAEAGQLKPRYQSETYFSLSDAPIPAYHLLDIAKYNRLTVQASRGCPHKCDFCASSILLTPRYEQKPIERVLAEIDTIRALWPRPFLEFADDNAFINRKYWKQLLPELAQRNLRWFCETDVSVHKDDELLALMRDAGCAEILIGFESPTDAGLNGMELNNNWKYRKWPEYIQAIRNIQSHGIRVNGCFVLGLDGHTTEIFEAIHQFTRESELFDVQITVATPFPGTPFYDRLKEQNRLIEPTNWDRCTLFDVNFHPQLMSAEELRQGLHHLAGKLYTEEETRWRRQNFSENYLWKAS